MTNQISQPSELEQIVTDKYEKLLQNIEKARLDDCVSDLRFLTEQLELVASMESAALVGDSGSTKIKLAVAEIRKAITGFLTEHGDTLSIALPADKILELDPLITRFANAVDRFEVRAAKIIDALEKYEDLYTGPRN